MLGIPAALGAIFSFLGGIAPAVSSYFTARTNAGLQGYEAQSTAEVAVAQAAVAANIATNNAKVTNSLQHVTHVLTLMFGIPPAIHMGMIYLTSALEPWLPGIAIHEVSPTFTSIEKDIALSFFILSAPRAIISAFKS